MKIENWCGYDIRFIEINGEWWAILKDICDALNLKTFESRVYSVDSTRDRFLVVDENKNFHWVSTNDCDLLKETKH